jgi:putative ABC transport system substrate-binding protein
MPGSLGRRGTRPADPAQECHAGAEARACDGRCRRDPIDDGAHAPLRTQCRLQAGPWPYLPADSVLGTQAQDVVIPTAIGIGMPTFASTEQLMQAGARSGLLSKYHSVGQFTAHKVEQIRLEKTAPEAVPIETPKRFSGRFASAQRQS